MPDTQNCDIFFTSWMKNLIKIEKLTDVLGMDVRTIIMVAAIYII